MKNLTNLLKESRYLDKIICILFFIFLLAMLELSARAVFPLRCELDKILNILQQDSELFWRQRPNLNLDFHGRRVKTNSSGLRIRAKGYNLEKNEDTFKIIWLGASPTFGWGVKAEDSYPYQLERILRQRRWNFLDVQNLVGPIIKLCKR